MSFWFVAGMIAWALVTIALFIGPFVIAVSLDDYEWFTRLKIILRIGIRTSVIIIGLALAVGSGAGFMTTIMDSLGSGIPADGCYRIQRTMEPTVISTGKITVVGEEAVPQFYSIPCPGGS
jgi:hypothetical protein